MGDKPKIHIFLGAPVISEGALVTEKIGGDFLENWNTINLSCHKGKLCLPAGDSTNVELVDRSQHTTERDHLKQVNIEYCPNLSPVSKQSKRTVQSNEEKGIVSDPHTHDQSDSRSKCSLVCKKQSDHSVENEYLDTCFPREGTRAQVDRNACNPGLSVNSEFLSVWASSQAIFLKRQPNSQLEIDKNSGDIIYQCQVPDVAVAVSEESSPELYSPQPSQDLNQAGNHIATRDIAYVKDNCQNTECTDYFSKGQEEGGLVIEASLGGLLCSQSDSFVDAKQPSSTSKPPALPLRKKFKRSPTSERTVKRIKQPPSVTVMPLKKCVNKGVPYHIFGMVLSPCHLKEVKAKSRLASGSAIPLAGIVVTDPSGAEMKVLLWRVSAFWALTVYPGDAVLITDLTVQEDRWRDEVVLQSKPVSKLLNLGHVFTVHPQQLPDFIESTMLTELQNYASKKYKHLLSIPTRIPQTPDTIQHVRLAKLRQDTLVHALLRVIHSSVLTDLVWDFRILMVRWGSLTRNLELHTTPWSSCEPLFPDDKRTLEFRSWGCPQQSAKEMDLCTLLSENYSGEVKLRAHIASLCFPGPDAGNVRLLVNFDTARWMTADSLSNITFTGCGRCCAELMADSNGIYRLCYPCLPFTGVKQYYRPAELSVTDGERMVLLQVPSSLVQKIFLNIPPEKLLTAVVKSFIMAPKRSAPVTASGAVPKRKRKMLTIAEKRGFRFRYECEGPSHGGLPGASSEKNKKTYPTVKICNHTGLAMVEVQLVTNFEPPRVHAHSLVGKQCNESGVCRMKVGPNDLTAQFNNLGILHVTKKGVHEVLRRRLREERLRCRSKDMPLSEREEQQIVEEARELGRIMDLNVVRLKFTAYLQDSEGNFTRALKPVISNPIYDSKSPNASNLKISRMDKTAGSACGGDEVFLLCDKVQKDDIEVRFYEDDEGGWEAYGDFAPTDVHKQFSARAMHVARQTGRALLDYATTGDARMLLAVQRQLCAVQDENGDSPLHLAIIHQQVSVIEQLVQVIVSIPGQRILNFTNNLLQTPLHLAVITRQHKVVEFLLKAGADPTLLDRFGNSVLHLAAPMGDEQMLSILLSHLKHQNVNLLNSPDYSGLYPIHLAVRKGGEKCLRLLLEYGANVDAMERKSGCTALHLAVQKNLLSAACSLATEFKADVNICNFGGNTPLHLAASLGSPTFCSMLIAAGAEKHLENDEPISLSSSSDEDEEEADMSGENMLETKQKELEARIDEMQISERQNTKASSNPRKRPFRGHTPYDLAKTKKVRDILAGTKTQPMQRLKQTEHPETGKHAALDSQTLSELCRILTKDNVSLKQLAEKLGMLTLADLYKECPTPCKSLLESFQFAGGQVEVLVVALESLGLNEGARLLRQAEQKNTQSNTDMTVDSGYGSQSIGEPDKPKINESNWDTPDQNETLWRSCLQDRKSVDMSEGQDLNSVLQGMSAQIQSLQREQAATKRELEETKSRLATAETVRPDPPRPAPPPLVPLSEADDIESYLGIFERTATRNQWQRSEWPSILAPYLKGTAQRAYYDLPEEEAVNYDLLKPEILARYSITPGQQASEW
ncbi:NFKB2 factor, partial [Polypterus senegalus]